MPEVYEGIQIDEWHSRLRKAIIHCGVEDKPLTFYLDEYKMPFDEQFEDLVTLLKNNTVTQFVRKSDVTLALTRVFQEIVADRRRKKGIIDETPDNLTPLQKAHLEQ